jgi:hypothetical protein
VYQGHFGLALSWMSSPLTLVQQRWVTGCMIQRLNAWGHKVPILLEGATSPIWFYGPDNNAYPFDESTAWGNVFSAAGPGVFVCSDQDLVVKCEQEGKSPLDWLHERVCDGLVSCGMTYVGNCWDPAVCTYQSGSRGTYPVCVGAGVTYTQTVHVQVPSSEATCTPAP